MNRCTKIVSTIGPASGDATTLERLIRAGMNVARLNFSHGTHADHAKTIQLIRSLSHDLAMPVTILQDLQGPKIRTGELENGQVTLMTDQQLILTTRPVIGNQQIVSVDFPHLLEGVKPGSRILLDDGNLELIVMNTDDIAEGQVCTRVVVGGVLKPHKGVNLPGTHINIPGFTDKDESDLIFGLQEGIDAVAVSFVRSENDIHQVRKSIASHAPERTGLPIIAKLERPEALDNLEAIMKAADGVMVARGDLGVEMPPETVPIAQKKIIHSANKHGKIVITATQMLDSMIKNPRPTRAEASDVANAIFDGTDAVMLSGETASGLYPVQSVEMMNAIACQAEAHMAEYGHNENNLLEHAPNDDTFYVTQAARELAQDRNVAAIAVFTMSGRTALLMSKTRPSVPVLAFTPREEVYHRMNLYWGVSPSLVPTVETIEDMIKVVEASIMATSPIRPGQQVIIICGFPILRVRPTNLALLHTIGDEL